MGTHHAHKCMQQLKWHDSLTQISGPTNESRPQCSFPTKKNALVMELAYSKRFFFNSFGSNWPFLGTLRGEGFCPFHLKWRAFIQCI
jgi:hypothetical protein